MRSAVVFSLLCLVSLAGCPDRTIARVNPEQGRVEPKNIPITPERNVDILFVIDDSVSMADKQNNLKANFKNFIDVLETIEGGLPDVHIGVVTSDLGTKGTQDSVPGPTIPDRGGCSGQGKQGNLQTFGTSLVTGKFISDIKNSDGTRSRNYTGTLTDAFSAIASAGDSGCFAEQHLEAAKRALNNNPANAGFLRPDAFLAIIFIADEDDCSFTKSTLLDGSSGSLATLGPRMSFRCTRFGITCDNGGANPTAMNQVGPKGSCRASQTSEYLTKVEDYVTFFKSLKPDDPKKVIVAGIMGTEEPFEVELRAPKAGDTPVPALAHSCTYTNALGKPEVADPPVRIKQFLDSFPDRSTFSTICQRDLSGGLTQIGQLLKYAFGDPCIEGTLADVDPNTAGAQYECSVSDVLHYGKANQSETVLPACNNAGAPASSTNKPCWAIEVDTVRCTKKLHQVLAVERTAAPAPDTHIVANCVTCADADNDGVCDK